ncbi:MAG: serine hydrolase domain-containing protein [Pseudomonadota bacterium]
MLKPTHAERSLYPPYKCIITFAIFLCASLATTRFSQGAPTLNAQAPAQTHEISAALSRLADKAIEGGAPGVILRVDGPEGVFDHAAGVAKKRGRAPMAVGSPMRIASVTKTFVAATAVLASKDGLIDLDQPIDQYLASADAETLGRAPFPTIRQLLGHRSGVRDYVDWRYYLLWDKRDAVTPGDALRLIKGRARTGDPGIKFDYSNTNYHVAALALEGATRASHRELLRARILNPLGLKNTSYPDEMAGEDPIHGYGGVLRPNRDVHYWRDAAGPDAGLRSTAADLSVFLRALFSDGGALKPVGDEMVGRALENKMRYQMGLGLEITTVTQSGAVFLGHRGDIVGYLTAAYYAPATDRVIVAHMNAWKRPLFETLVDELMALAQAPAPESASQ